MNHHRRRKKEKKGGESLEAAEGKFNSFVAKQEKTLRVSFYLLLNLAEDPKVEEKMKKKRIIFLLSSTLSRKNTELLILVVSFLKKMSCYAENKDEMKMLNLVDKLIPLLGGPSEGGKATQPSPDLVHAVVRDDLNQMDFMIHDFF